MIGASGFAALTADRNPCQKPAGNDGSDIVSMRQPLAPRASQWRATESGAPYTSACTAGSRLSRTGSVAIEFQPV